MAEKVYISRYFSKNYCFSSIRSKCVPICGKTNEYLQKDEYFNTDIVDHTNYNIFKTDEAADLVDFKGFTNEEQQQSLEISLKIIGISNEINNNLKNFKKERTKYKRQIRRVEQRKDFKKEQRMTKPKRNNKKVLTKPELNNGNNKYKYAIEEVLSNKIEMMSINKEKVSKPKNTNLDMETSVIKKDVENLNLKIYDSSNLETNVELNTESKHENKSEENKYHPKASLLKYDNFFMSIKKEERTKVEDEFKNLKVKTELKVNHTEIDNKMDLKPPNYVVCTPRFVPPKSPHNLLEEDLYYNPWALLVATIFLNKTSCKTARPYVFWFLEENSSPEVVLEGKIEDLEKYFIKLGLQRTRATQIWRMSYDFLHKNWKSAEELYGIGRYGKDAFRMFCLGDFSVEPKDRFLRIYKAWYEMFEKKGRIHDMNI